MTRRRWLSVYGFTALSRDDDEPVKHLCVFPGKTEGGLVSHNQITGQKRFRVGAHRAFDAIGEKKRRAFMRDAQFALHRRKDEVS